MIKYEYPEPGTFNEDEYMLWIYDGNDPDVEEGYIPDWTPEWLYDFIYSTNVAYSEAMESLFQFPTQEERQEMIKAIKEYNGRTRN